MPRPHFLIFCILGSFFLTWGPARVYAMPVASLTCAQALEGYDSRYEQSPVEKFLLEQEAKVPPVVIPAALRVAVVIPVFRELKTGNIYRLLRRFVHQSAAADRYRLVFVVNNTPKVARERSEVWEENQETLRFLEALSRKEIPEWGYGDIAHAVRERNLSIQVLDYSTHGIDRNIGKLRHIGATAAIEAYGGDPKNLVLTAFDADTLPPPQYINEILKAFSRPQTDSALFGMRFRLPPGSPPELHATHYRAWGYYSIYDLNFALLNIAPKSGTPRIVTRASEYLAAGGFRSVDMSEDAAFIAATGKKNGHAPLWRYPVISSDRMRSDGYDAKNRLEQLSLYLKVRGDQLQGRTEMRQHLNSVRRFFRDLPQNEKAVLNAEYSYWKKLAIAEMRGVRRQLLGEGVSVVDAVADWESAGNASFWKDPGAAAELDWADYRLSFDGKLPLEMSLGVQAEAMLRFLELARQYPELFPQTCERIAAFQDAENEKHRAHEEAVKDLKGLANLVSLKKFSISARATATQALAMHLSSSSSDPDHVRLMLLNGPPEERRQEYLERISSMLLQIAAGRNEFNEDERNRFFLVGSFWLQNLLLNFDHTRTHGLESAFNHLIRNNKHLPGVVALLVIALVRQPHWGCRTLATLYSLPADTRAEVTMRFQKVAASFPDDEELQQNFVHISEMLEQIGDEN